MTHPSPDDQSELCRRNNSPDTIFSYPTFELEASSNCRYQVLPVSGAAGTRYSKKIIPNNSNILLFRK
jgi:hypothetical protein